MTVEDTNRQRCRIIEILTNRNSLIVPTLQIIWTTKQCNYYRQNEQKVNITSSRFDGSFSLETPPIVMSITSILRNINCAACSNSIIFLSNPVLDDDPIELLF